jgi:hypothetical protein
MLAVQLSQALLIIYQGNDQSPAPQEKLSNRVQDDVAARDYTIVHECCEGRHLMIVLLPANSIRVIEALAQSQKHPHNTKTFQFAHLAI